MFSYKDDVYRISEKVKVGTSWGSIFKKSKIDLKFTRWFNEQFGVNALYCALTYLQHGSEKNARLDVVFDRHEDLISYIGNSLGDEKTSRLNSQLAEKFLLHPSKNKWLSKSISSVFCRVDSFERISMMEAVSKVERESIEKLKKKDGFEQLWDISVFFENVAISMYTEDQSKFEEKQGKNSKVVKAFLELVDSNDRFCYRNHSFVSFTFISKEVLDSKYGGSFYNWRR